MSAPRSAQLLLSKALTRALSVQALKPSAGTRAGVAAGKNAAASGKNAVKAPPPSASSSSPPSSASSAHQHHHQASQGKQADAARQGFSKMFF